LIQTSLDDYLFKWGGGCMAVALGLGSLYNHSYAPNARYYQDTPGRRLEFVAICPIRAGEEITVNYNGDPEGRSALWFPVQEDCAGHEPERIAEGYRETR
jgi:hypothetical protein